MTKEINYYTIHWRKLTKSDKKILSLLHKPDITINDSTEIAELLDIPQNIVNRAFKKFIRMGLLEAEG